MVKFSIPRVNRWNVAVRLNNSLSCFQAQLRVVTLYLLKDEIMQTRIDQRTSFLLVTTVKNLIPTCDALLKKTGILEDGLKTARMELASIESTINNLIPQLDLYEKNRDSAKISISLYDALKKARKRADEARENKDNLKPDFDDKQNKLRNKLDQLNEAANQARLDKIGTTAEDIKKENEKFNDLADKKDSLNTQRNRIQAKIDKKCCGCMPSCVKKELKQIADLDRQIDEINSQIPRIKENLDKLNAEDIVANLQKKIDSVKADIKSNIDKYPEKESKAEKEYVKAQGQLAEITDSINKLNTEHYNALSTAVMFDVIHIVAKFERFESAVITAYEQKMKHNPKDKQLRELDELRGILDHEKKKIFDYLQQLTCPDSGKRSGVDIYQAYLQLDAALQKKFTDTDYSQNELINKIVPEIEPEPSRALRISARLFAPAASSIPEETPKHSIKI